MLQGGDVVKLTAPTVGQGIFFCFSRRLPVSTFKQKGQSIGEQNVSITSSCFSNFLSIDRGEGRVPRRAGGPNMYVCALHCTLVLLHAAQNKRHTACCHATLMFRVSRCTLPSTRNLDVEASRCVCHPLLSEASSLQKKINDICF